MRSQYRALHWSASRGKNDRSPFYIILIAIVINSCSFFGIYFRWYYNEKLGRVHSVHMDNIDIVHSCTAADMVRPSLSPILSTLSEDLVPALISRALRRLCRLTDNTRKEKKRGRLVSFCTEMCVFLKLNQHIFRCTGYV